MNLTIPEKTIDDLVLDISLVSSYPVGVNGRNYIIGVSAANQLAVKTAELEKKELRELEYTIGPLLTILVTDLDNPLAAKAAFGIRSLIPSQICMSMFFSEQGLEKCEKIFDSLLGNDMLGIHSYFHRQVILNLAICYREIARFYPLRLVDVGALRHCVLLLRHGDIELKTVS